MKKELWVYKTTYLRLQEYFDVPKYQLGQPNLPELANQPVMFGLGCTLVWVRLGWDFSNRQTLVGLFKCLQPAQPKPWATSKGLREHLLWTSCSQEMETRELPLRFSIMWGIRCDMAITWATQNNPFNHHFGHNSA